MRLLFASGDLDISMGKLLAKEAAAIGVPAIAPPERFKSIKGIGIADSKSRASKIIKNIYKTKYS